MKQRMRLVVGVVVSFLAICAAVSVVRVNVKYEKGESYAQIRKNALEMYSEGSLDAAIAEMEFYCSHIVTDIESKAILGDWYFEKGDESKAYETYYEAAENKPSQEEEIKSLSVKNTHEIIGAALSEVVLEIVPDVRRTKNMTLSITGQNIVPEKRLEGKIAVGEERLDENADYLTTDWFDIDIDGKYLTMSGGFNCAVWQFKTEEGIICLTEESTNTYRVANSNEATIYPMARVRIPDEARKCRVTYFNKANEDITACTDEELTIVYGRMPGESRKPTRCDYDIPDLAEGEKIVYDKSGWKMVTKSGEKSLDEWQLPSIERGSYLSLGGTLPGRVLFDGCEVSKYPDDGIYTIKFDNNTSSAMGQRADDAANLGFNASLGTTTITTNENDFDNIYPWRDMKLCCIKDGRIVYKGEKEFFDNGSSGDVFVEIPKFYVRRIVDDRYDSISISGAPHEGFETDEAFVTESGEVDKIYVAAYASGLDEENRLTSASGIMPALGMSANEIKQKTQNKGNGYKEIDYAALNALQKLFAVETGLRNSQYIYTGVCAYTPVPTNKKNCITAKTSNNNTNCIELDRDYGFTQGNSIVLYDANDIEKSYMAALNDVREVKSVKKNSDGSCSVYFSGDGTDVTRSVTAIASVALKNGGSRTVSEHTGASSTARGTVSFKYRNIENLWGNAYIYVDNVTIKGNTATVTDRRGEKNELAYKMPEKSDDTHMIRRLGYDFEKPQIMLPCETGSGASSSTYYGDEYISGDDEEKEYVLHYGGDWSSQMGAGLFSYAAFCTAEDAESNIGGRMMYIK